MLRMSKRIDEDRLDELYFRREVELALMEADRLGLLRDENEDDAGDEDD